METKEISSIDVLEFENDIKPDSPVPEVIETDRLELRKIGSIHTDVHELHELLHDLEDPDEVFRLCGWRRSESLGDTIDFVESREKAWRNGRFEYAVVEKSSGEYAGTAYMEFSEGLTDCELGYWMRKPFWGEEYSSEISDAFVHIAFKLVDVNYVEVGCLSENEKSLRAMQKYLDRYGAVFTGTNVVNSSSYMDVEERTLAHHEFVVRKSDFESEETGITTEIPGINFGDTGLER